MSLTPAQNQTFQNLRNRNYSVVGLARVTRLLNSVFNKRETMEKSARESIKLAAQWYLSRPENKNKTKSEIKNIMVKKIKKLPSNNDPELPTKYIRDEARKIFGEIEDELDVPSEEEEKKHDDGPDGSDDEKDEGIGLGFTKKQKQKIEEMKSSSKTKKKQKKPELEDYYPMSVQQHPQVYSAPIQAGWAPLPARISPVEEKYPDPDDDDFYDDGIDLLAPDERPRPNRKSPFEHLSKYVDAGSDFYKENQKTINKVLAALQQKNFDDGSYLTKLAAIEYPEIEIFQKIIKGVGLGFTNKDKQLYEDMLSPSKKKRDSVSQEDRVRLTFKSIINPDQIGVLLKKGGEGLIQGAKDWWELMTTGKKPLSFDEKEIQTKIDERREDIQKSKDRKKTIDKWYGVEDKPQLPPPAIKPISDGEGIKGGGVVINPDLPVTEIDDSIISSYDLLLPPNYRDYKNTTAGRTMAESIAEMTSYGMADLMLKILNPDNSIDFLKFQKYDPEGYEKYKNALDEYNKKINKAGLDKDVAVDYKISKDYVDNTANITEELIKKAIANGRMDREQGEMVYDLWNNFNNIKTGDLQISYDQMQQLQQKLFEVIPREILSENKQIIDDYVNQNKEYIVANWEGDSDLGNFEWIDKLLNPEIEDADIKEKQIKPTKQPPMIEPKYRYRGKWGGTDEIFQKAVDEVEKRNLVIEVQRLREDLDTTNKLVQAQLSYDKRRFSNCFEMPAPQPYQSRKLPEKFKREHRAIFQPAVIQNPIRPFEKNTRDEASFEQYKQWTPKEMKTTARMDMMSNPLIYPSNVDMATGGEDLYVAPAKDFNYILNSRFIK